MTPLMENRSAGYGFYAGVVGLLLGSVGLVVVQAVKVKMLPFDNKSEFQVVLDLPEGTTLETSNALGQEIASYLRRVPEVKSTRYTRARRRHSTSTDSFATTSCARARTSPTSR